MSEFNHDVDVFDVANFFIQSDSEREDPDVTPMKLHKLLYFAQANFLASTGHRLFSEDVEAFEHGPVVYRISNKFFGKQIISVAAENSEQPPVKLPEDIREFLEKIWQKYKDFSASRLRDISHGQSPWADVYKQSEYRIQISDHSMMDYFSQMIPLNDRVFHDSVVVLPNHFLSDIDETESINKLRSFLSV